MNFDFLPKMSILFAVFREISQIFKVHFVIDYFVPICLEFLSIFIRIFTLKIMSDKNKNVHMKTIHRKHSNMYYRKFTSGKMECYDFS